MKLPRNRGRQHRLPIAVLQQVRLGIRLQETDKHFAHDMRPHRSEAQEGGSGNDEWSCVHGGGEHTSILREGT